LADAFAMIYILLKFEVKVIYSRFALLFTAHALEASAFSSAALALLNKYFFRRVSHALAVTLFTQSETC